MSRAWSVSDSERRALGLLATSNLCESTRQLAADVVRAASWGAEWEGDECAVAVIQAVIDRIEGARAAGIAQSD